jgi:hypothetical protein
MRFRFCGDLDAPDWLLAEITTLSKVSPPRMRLLVQMVVDYIIAGTIDYDEVSKVTSEELAGKSDMKGAVSALHFALSNSAKYGVEDTTLLLEIQQLGLPKENADLVAGAFRESKDAMQARFAQKSYQVNTLGGVAWRVDRLIASSPAASTAGACDREVHLKFTVDAAPQAEGGAVTEVACAMPADKFQVLHTELRKARAQMAALEG